MAAIATVPRERLADVVYGIGNDVEEKVWIAVFCESRHLRVVLLLWMALSEARVVVVRPTE